jgi:hypothetical protein
MMYRSVEEVRMALYPRMARLLDLPPGALTGVRAGDIGIEEDEGYLERLVPEEAPVHETVPVPVPAERPREPVPA